MTRVSNKPLIDHGLLLEMLHYDPNTGIFTWKIQKGRAKRGAIAGKQWNNAQTGRVIGLRLRIGQRAYLCHRLAWYYMTGVWPPEEIDHKNVDRLDNRWDNLRLATRAENQRNVKAQKNNRLGVKGVTFTKGRYWARLMVDRKVINLGYHHTLDAAVKAYAEGSKKYHGEFGRTS